MPRENLRQAEELKDILQLFKGSDSKGRPYRRRYSQVVDVYLVDTRIDSALDIYLYTIPDHDARGRVGRRLTKSIFEDLFVRLQTVGSLGGDHFPEIAVDARILQFTVLRLLEPVGDEMQLIALSFEIGKDLDSIGEKDIAGGEGVEELFTHLPGQGFVADLEIEQGQPHTLPAQLVYFDKAVAVAIPELVVMDDILFMKLIEAGHSPGGQVEGMVHFLQGLAA